MAHSRAKKEVMKDTHKNWIKGAINPDNKGALHRSLGVPEGKKIPEKKLEKAEHSKNPTLKKQAVLAETLRNFKHKG
jgi:hypothetical protein